MTTSIQVPNYKIISVDPKTDTMVIQFEDGYPLNYRAPTCNGAWLSGDALDTWIKNLRMEQHNLALDLNASNMLTGIEAVQAVVDATGFPTP